ncbi:hypothetical protein D8S78_23775 [Natrialba swarupiae]|nr:hypothetical protein [Natrialba swarupiae]
MPYHDTLEHLLEECELANARLEAFRERATSRFTRDGLSMDEADGLASRSHRPLPSSMHFQNETVIGFGSDGTVSSASVTQPTNRVSNFAFETSSTRSVCSHLTVMCLSWRCCPTSIPASPIQ